MMGLAGVEEEGVLTLRWGVVNFLTIGEAKP
jgi:hypothetical protein